MSDVLRVEDEQDGVYPVYYGEKLLGVLSSPVRIDADYSRYAEFGYGRMLVNFEVCEIPPKPKPREHNTVDLAELQRERSFRELLT